MTDIVERLRSPEAVLDGDLLFEAADEIERLRAENAEMLRALKLAYKLPRPWMDGGVTSKQWIEAYDAIFTIIDKSRELESKP